MFFCEPCRVERNWPEAIRKSFGPCELCKKSAPCHDIPSYALPPARFEEKTETETQHPQEKFFE